MRRFFERLQEAADGAAVATVIRVGGSAYRREGARLLIQPDGSTTGLISGGCLEADLAERLRPRLPLSAAEVIVYEEGQGEPWALPLGCGGRIELLVEPVSHLHRRLAAEWLAGRPSTVVMRVRQGTVGLRCADGSWLGATSGEVVEEVQPPPLLWIVGVGPEAEPLAAAALATGWRVRVVDARLVDPNRFPGAEAVANWEPVELARQVGPGEYAVIMHHHLEFDRAYLKELLAAPLRYLGLLGPLHRTMGLLDGRPLPDHLYAPVGLDTGGEGPDAIALSILAELQTVHHGRSGGHLRGRGRVS